MDEIARYMLHGFAWGFGLVHGMFLALNTLDWIGLIELARAGA